MTDEGMAELLQKATAFARERSARHRLGLEISHHDVFAACANDPEATGLLAAALTAEGIAISDDGLPMRGSENFGLFGSLQKSAMFFLGAGVQHLMLLNPDYDFPDELVPVGARVFDGVVRGLLG